MYIILELLSTSPQAQPLSLSDIPTYKTQDPRSGTKVLITSMAPFTPYVFLQCPCTDTSTPVRRLGEGVSANEEENDEDERAFDPRAPRSNYSLYPPEHLLYCADCQQIRCPRCALDEIVSWFCPNCLFEVPSGTVKSEGTRYDSYFCLRIWLLTLMADAHAVASNALYAQRLSPSVVQKHHPKD